MDGMRGGEDIKLKGIYQRLVSFFTAIFGRISQVQDPTFLSIKLIDYRAFTEVKYLLDFQLRNTEERIDISTRTLLFNK